MFDLVKCGKFIYYVPPGRQGEEDIEIFLGVTLQGNVTSNAAVRCVQRSLSCLWKMRKAMLFDAASRSSIEDVL